MIVIETSPDVVEPV